jgi:hypothetical protein
MSDPFYEDYFQRVVNVNWDSEPECYFLAGDGDNFVNSISSGGGKVWRSNDGKSWYKILDDDKVTALPVGLWMRQNFRPDWRPVWILAGQGESGIICPALVNSFDAQSFQKQYFPDALVGVVPDNETALGFFNRLHVDNNTLAVADVWRFLTPTGVSYGSANGVDWHKDGASAPPPPTPPPPAKPIPKNTRIFQIGRQISAFGKVREGRYKGRSLMLKIQQIDPHHFNSTIQVFDQKTGKSLGTSDSGIPFGCSMAYGHYVFVIVGGVDLPHEGAGAIGQGAIAWSDDGLNWHTQKMESFVMGGLAVGARE